MMEIIQPVFENSVDVVIVADGDFCYPLGVLIESIYQNKNKKDNYDVIVLYTKISNNVMEQVIDRYNLHNFSVRFFNVVDAIEKNDFFKKRMSLGLGLATWFRLLIIDIMPDYKKVIYLDADVVVNSDISELANISMEEDTVAVAVDDIMGNWRIYDSALNTREYREKNLGIKDPSLYFNAGVIVMKPQEIKTKFCNWGGWDRLDLCEFESADQDILNILCEDSVKWLGYEWNLIAACDKRGITYIPDKSYHDWELACLNPKVIHYTGNSRPWLEYEGKYFDIFWKYAYSSCTFVGCLDILFARNVDKQIMRMIDSGKMSIKRMLKWIKYALTLKTTRENYNDR